MIRIGQIGIGHNHGSAKMEAVRHFPDLFQVVGYAEEQEDWIRKRGNLPCYRDLPRLSVRQILDRSDAILVETDVWDLTQTAQLCIDAGKHIHMDKPASGSLDAYRSLLDDAKARQLVVQLGYMYRYNPAVQIAMDYAKSGKLGTIYSINAEMSTFHALDYKQWLTHFPGGIMYILGSHLVDLIVTLMGKPDRITAFLKHTGSDGIDFADNTQAILEYGNALARIHVSSVEVNGWGRRQLVVCGSQGTVEIKPLENTTHMTWADVSHCTHAYEDQKEVIETPDIPKDKRYDTMMRDFYDYITGVKENPYTYEHEYLVQKILAEIIKEDPAWKKK